MSTITTPVDALTLPYYGSRTTIVPIAKSFEEFVATKDVKRYAIKGFNLSRWHCEFFEDCIPINQKITPLWLKRILELDLAVLDGGEPIFKTHPNNIPFLADIVRKRAAAIEFPASDAVCLFLAYLSATPAHAVMYTTATACSWQSELYLKALSSKTDLEKKHWATTPDMYWILSGYVDDVLAKKNIGMNIPSDKHLDAMWELQKIEDASVRYNALDVLGFVDSDAVISLGLKQAMLKTLRQANAATAATATTATTDQSGDK